MSGSGRTAETSPGQPLEDADAEAVVGCLNSLISPSEALRGARQCYGAGREEDPRFESAAVRRLQNRARALVRGECCPALGIGEPELRREKLALQLMGVSAAQFAALFLYSEEITSEAKEGQGSGTEGKQPSPSVSPLPKPKPTPDQLYALLTSAQRAAVGANPEPAAHAVLAALSPMVSAIWEYLTKGPVPKVNPEQDVLYRGANYEVDLATSEGKHAWMCFSSASLSASSARGFLRPGGTLFVVRSAAAVAMFFLSAFMEELECLVPPTEFIVRDALPVSILRMMGVQGSVMLLEDPKVWARPSSPSPPPLSRYASLSCPSSRGWSFHRLLVWWP